MPAHKACRLSVAHINDTHSYFEPSLIQLNVVLVDKDGVEQHYDPYISVGGFARIKTRVEQLRQQAREQQRGFLFLHAGDCFQGTLYFSLYKGLANADMLNRLGIDAMAVGNHELDLGNEPFAHFARHANFDLLAGNWDLSGELADKTIRLVSNEKILSYDPITQTARYKIYSCNGEPVALFGITQDHMNDISNPDPDTPFVDAVAVIRNTLNLFKQKNINKIILLSHLGYEEDKAIARQFNEISLIIGGHSHMLQGDFSQLGLANNEHYGQCIAGTYVVQTGLYSQAIGHCDIDFAADGSVTRFNGKNQLLCGRRLFFKHQDQVVDGSANLLLKEFIQNHPNVSVVAKNADLHRYLHETYTYEVRKLEADKIAYLPVSLRHIRIPDQSGGSDIAPLVARSFRHILASRGYPTDFSIHNAGGVRCSLNSGEITSADISGKLLPFAIPIGRYKIRGEQIKAVLEGALNNALNNGVVGTGSGSYPYCDGLRFVYCAENALGQRITELLIFQNSEWVPVLMKQAYYGTSTIYTMKGKEGYDAILQLEEPAFISDITMAEAFVIWLKNSQYCLADSDT